MFFPARNKPFFILKPLAYQARQYHFFCLIGSIIYFFIESCQVGRVN
ncbi:hypothetical protein TREAZ_2154 [Leadbettera azotonutricia ZAS-9]|uniref:Uncharacterized protein n=1 Tax=Leadbettera azotonutricia (strain ATCC BAA-888 / DSM 13862 / ZAS-9) TaxID=545695 RepID=F5Y9A7_LEAAZ|nr:hypothetical protein TREAZ_2154 [Leadbettera azotonutricia ZAS-9]